LFNLVCEDVSFLGAFKTLYAFFCDKVSFFLGAARILKAFSSVGVSLTGSGFL
jgi:hypothetical protein